MASWGLDSLSADGAMAAASPASLPATGSSHLRSARRFSREGGPQLPAPPTFFPSLLTSPPSADLLLEAVLGLGPARPALSTVLRGLARHEKRPDVLGLGRQLGTVPVSTWPCRHDGPCWPDPLQVVPGPCLCRTGLGRPVGHIYSLSTICARGDRRERTRHAIVSVVGGQCVRARLAAVPATGSAGSGGPQVPPPMGLKSGRSGEDSCATAGFDAAAIASRRSGAAVPLLSPPWCSGGGRADRGACSPSCTDGAFGPELATASVRRPQI